MQVPYPRGRTVTQAQRSVGRPGQVGFLREPSRFYIGTSGSLTTGVSATTQIQINSEGYVVALFGGADTGAASGTALLNYRDSFRIMIMRQTGDKFFTASAPGHVVLGTPERPFRLSRPWWMAAGEVLQLEFVNITSGTNTYYVGLVFNESRLGQ